ncbi:MAG: EamA family transporter [Candidatus Riflebacteria bacterium]|nr:EamA family transporter [Candidatus Riflebacteria bacterium]
MSNRAAFWVLVFMNIIWGGSYAVSKWVLNYIPPTFLAATRFLLGGILLLFFSEGKTFQISKKHWMDLTWVYGLGISLSFIAQYQGIKLTTALKASMEMTLEPLFVILLAISVLKEPLKLQTLFGLTMSVLGTVLLVFDGKSITQIWGELKNGGQILGDILMLFSIFLGSAYSIFSKPLTKKMGPIKSTAWGCILSSVMLLPLVALEIQSGCKFEFNTSVFASIFFLGVICTALGYALWNKILVGMPASEMAITLNIQPIAGVAIGMIFLGERIGLIGCLGGIIILVGIWMVPFSSV